MHSKGIKNGDSVSDDDDFEERVLRKIENERRLAKKRKIRKISEGFSLLTYFSFILIRFALVIIPQYGYIHPDEFFQSSEVISGEFAFKFLKDQMYSNFI